MGDNRTIDLADGAIEYQWYPAPPAADDRRTVLVLLHEGLGCVDLWRDFPDRLAARTGLPVLAYSRYGYGGSAPCALPRPISYMHDEGLTVLPALLSALRIDDHILIGHSDGGSVTLINAGGAPAPGLRGIVTLAAHIFCEDVSVRSIAAATEAFNAGKLRDALARYHGDNVDCAFRGWAESWLNPVFLDWNIEDLLPRIRVPALIIQGESDAYGTERQVQGIVDGIERGPDHTSVEALMIAECGHAPQNEQPDQTLDAISKFIARILSA